MSKRNVTVLVVATASLIGLVGCGLRQDPPSVETPAPQPSPSTRLEPDRNGTGLAGTAWQLVEYRSMNDAIGTVEPEDPEAYTITFDEDGTVAMRLNCNRGTGLYEISGEESDRSGSLELGPIATTKALCPPPSMDERIAADIPYMTGWFLDDEGRLAISLMADAGIYLWEPTPTVGEPTGSAE